jgi:ABC-type branched-subunit amino acid transport system permease subunit
MGLRAIFIGTRRIYGGRSVCDCDSHLSPEQKQVIYFIEPIRPFLGNLHLSFFPALIIAGLISAFFGLIIGGPTLRLKGDYLAIATLGFSEIIRVVFNNTVTITNGALGLKNIPEYTNLYWSWGWAIFTVFFIKRLVNSSYGRAMMGIRDNEVAAEAMGVQSFFRIKLWRFWSIIFRRNRRRPAGQSDTDDRSENLYDGLNLSIS